MKVFLYSISQSIHAIFRMISIILLFTFCRLATSPRKRYIIHWSLCRDSRFRRALKSLPSADKRCDAPVDHKSAIGEGLGIPLHFCCDFRDMDVILETAVLVRYHRDRDCHDGKRYFLAFPCFPMDVTSLPVLGIIKSQDPFVKEIDDGTADLLVPCG